MFLPRELPADRPPGFQRRQHAEILGQHLLLAAETAAHSLGEHMDVACGQAEDMREFLLGDERRLRAGADVDAPVRVAPGDRAVRLEMDVLHAGGGIGVVMHHIGGGEPVRRVAHLAVDVGIDVAVLRNPLLVQDRRIRPHRRLRIEHRRQYFVLHVEQPAGRLRRRLGLGDDGRDPLTDESDDVVEHIGVVRIDEMVLVGGAAVEAPRHVFPGEDRDHPRHPRRLFTADADDPRMGVRRAQHLEVQHAGDNDIHRVAGLPGHDRLGERIGQARPASVAGDVRLDRADAVQRVGDGAVSGAAAEISFEGVRQVGALLLIECGRGHDHAGGAEPALERVRVQERLLHRVQRAALGQSLDRRHLPPGGAERGHQAGMHRRAVEPHGAGAAIAGIAALLHAEAALLAQEGPQALARLGRRPDPTTVDGEGESGCSVIAWRSDVVHAAAPSCASSARICSANWYVR